MNGIDKIQYVFLAGGKGTRLGKLTEGLPKPLVNINSKPFLYYQIQYLYKYGVRKFLFLIGYKADTFHAYLSKFRKEFPLASFAFSEENAQLGTAGAIKNAENMLEDRFILSNGDTFCNVMVNGLLECEKDKILLVNHTSDSDRYGRVEVNETNGQVKRFVEKNHNFLGNLINSGIYFFNKKNILNGIEKGKKISLEKSIIPFMIKEKKLFSVVQDSKFIDIGIPSDLQNFKKNLHNYIKTPGVILDRDGTINQDKGYTHKIEDLIFIKGSIDLLLFFTKNNVPLFIATNQAGIAKGFFTDKQSKDFTNNLIDSLRERKISILDYEYCPYHVDAKIKKFRKDSNLRKPNSGMLEKIIKKWNLDKDLTLYIGDKEIDVMAAKNAKVNHFHFKGGDLFNSFFSLPTSSTSIYNQ